MSCRRQTNNRRILYRTCGTCGRLFSTTADNPFIRQIARDGKRQATTYYCTESCYAASYKYIGWFDGQAWVRKKEREKSRDRRESNRRYYAQNREKELARAKARYWADPEQARADMRYYRRKRKLIQEGGTAV